MPDSQGIVLGVTPTEHSPPIAVQAKPQVAATQCVAVSNLPPAASEAELLHVLNTALCASALSTALGSPVLSVHLDASHCLAVAAVRSAKEAARLLRFDGMEVRGAALTMRCPQGLSAAQVRRG